MTEPPLSPDSNTERTVQALATSTLEQIDGERWGPAPQGASYLVRTAHHLRTLPLSELDTEALRLLVGQQISLDITVPLAVGRLTQDPLAEGDFYPGDLLAAVIRVPAAWFARHPAVAAAVDGVVAAVAAVDASATDEYGLSVLEATDLPALLEAWTTSRARDHSTETDPRGA